MVEAFDREVLTHLPLAEATLVLWRWICDDQSLDDLFQRHRGACYEKKISFATMVRLIRDALLQHQGSACQSFDRAREDGQLDAARSSAYDKLGRLPLALSEAFLAESTVRLRQVFPDLPANPVPAALQGFQVQFVDGKAAKRVAKRRKATRGHKGGLLGGKGLVALEMTTGLAVALATDPDGEANDAKLVPDLLPQVRAQVAGCRLWVADRQFCDLKQTRTFTADGDHFLVRYHPKTAFCPDPQRPARRRVDGEGRVYVEDGGWLGREGNKDRRYVRRITLERPGEETLILITDLLDADVYLAVDLLTIYRQRWTIEGVFQQITEVFHLQGLIGTTPQGTLFQMAFCLLLYNLLQVVRAYVAVGQGRAVTTVSTELLFEDVTRQLVALSELVPVESLAGLIAPQPTAAAVRRQLHRLLGGVWSERWVKAPQKKRQTAAHTSGKRDHTSVFRLLNAQRQQKKEPPSVT